MLSSEKDIEIATLKFYCYTTNKPREVTHMIETNFMKLYNDPLGHKAV